MAESLYKLGGDEVGIKSPFPPSLRPTHNDSEVRCYVLFPRGKRNGSATQLAAAWRPIYRSL